ncbi:hydroxymyristoyl-ACP dehydratase [Clostridium sp. JN-1]|jgi:hypothetical protein|uniref:hydroxymyristoyl-ACP dehydratase n=1 Tax=Clostridium sp. JN-1 TaxID=2483110 RepID=UPI000F0BD9D4|nr:hydroxymyristoyl-ACP dehydratase [Clostridium sp. JN-1]
MMNINCSEKCIHEENGKCTLDRIMPLSNVFNNEAKCAYFTARKSSQSGFPKK